MNQVFSTEIDCAHTGPNTSFPRLWFCDGAAVDKLRRRIDRLLSFMYLFDLANCQDSSVMAARGVAGERRDDTADLVVRESGEGPPRIVITPEGEVRRK